MPPPFLDRVATDRELPDHADVVVVGAGIVGVSAALELAERGLRVLICEKGRVAGEQSSRNWGFVRKMGRDAAELPLALRSLAIWREVDARHGIETGFRKTGIVFAGSARRKEAEFARWAALGREHGIDVRLLGRDAIRDLVPGLGAGNDVAMHTPDDGRAEPSLAVPAMAGAARRMGVAIVERCALRGIERSGGRVSGVVTERGPVRCDAVLVAAGAWSRAVLAPVGVDLPQLPIIGSVARIDDVSALPPMPFAGERVAWRRREDGGATIALRDSSISPVTADAIRLLPDYLPAYLKSWRELRLRPASACPAALRARSCDAGAFERSRELDPEPDEGTLRDALRALHEALPATRGARVTHRWAGVMDVTPDAVPVIDAVERVPGLHVASGFSGHGFGLGPGAGLLAAQIIAGERPCVDPAPFRLARFGRRAVTLQPKEAA